MRHAIFLSLIFLPIVFFISSLSAAETCYDESHYPSIDLLRRTEAGIVAQLGGQFSNPVETLIYTPKKEWEKRESFCGFDLCFKKEKSGPLPQVELSLEAAVILRPEIKGADETEQRIISWDRHGNTAWFGIGFYSGEGMSGVGGVGRYDFKTERMEIRRLALIRDSSIGPILYDGKSLWFGTFGSYECIGTPPTHGLIRYDWKTDRIESFEGKSESPCGFLVNDLLQDSDSLWVATSLGLSILDIKSATWRHFVPQPEVSPFMREITCPDLYFSLLKTLPKGDREGAYYQLFHELSRFQPILLKGYVVSRPPPERDCSDIQFLAGQVSDVETLQKEVLSVHPVGSPHFECWIDGFGRKKSSDPRWRDLLLSIIALPRDENFQPISSALHLLTTFPGDEEAGRAILHFLEGSKPNTRPYGHISAAFTVLPALLGKKSIPFLITALDRFEEDPAILTYIGEALEQASDHYWNPSEGIKPLPRDDTYPYLRVTAKYLFIEQWKNWWRANQKRYLSSEERP